MPTIEYAVILERSATGYGAYVPDLPGCVAVARTEAEARKLIREGIETYLEDMRRDGEPIPVPTSQVAYASVAETASAAWGTPGIGGRSGCDVATMQYPVIIEKGPTSYGRMFRTSRAVLLSLKLKPR